MADNTNFDDYSEYDCPSIFAVANWKHVGLAIAPIVAVFLAVAISLWVQSAPKTTAGFPKEITVLNSLEENGVRLFLQKFRSEERVNEHVRETQTAQLRH